MCMGKRFAKSWENTGSHCLLTQIVELMHSALVHTMRSNRAFSTDIWLIAMRKSKSHFVTTHAKHGLLVAKLLSHQEIARTQDVNAANLPLRSPLHSQRLAAECRLANEFLTMPSASMHIWLRGIFQCCVCINFSSTFRLDVGSIATLFPSGNAARR